MFTNIYFIKEEDNTLLSTEFGIFKLDNYEFNSLLNQASYLSYMDLLILLYKYKFQIDASYSNKIKEIFSNLKNFYKSKSKNKNIKAICYYYNRFKLYTDSILISNLLYYTFSVEEIDEINEIKRVFSNVSYNTFLSILRENLNHQYDLPRIVLLFPRKYLEKENTIEMLASTKFTFKSMHFFNEKDLFLNKNNIKETFSFISTLPKQKVIKYIKPTENEIFINVIAPLINDNYFDDISFASLFLPFKTVLKDEVPFNIKRTLIDNIGKKHNSYCLDIFEKELPLLTKEEIIKLLSYSTKIKINEYLRKLYECKHSIFEDKNILIELIKEGYNILSFVDFNIFSPEEMKLIKKQFSIDLDSDTVRVKLHPNINNKYKFEYDRDEILPNGCIKETFLSSKLNNKYDKFVFEFLIHSSDIELLFINYYEKYKNIMIKKYGEEKFLQIDTIYHFLKFILAEKNSNNEISMPNLEKIYKSLNLTNIQVEHIRNLICTIEPSYEERINKFLINQRNIALSKYNSIVRMHLNGENIGYILESIGLNKEMLISEIIKMRNLYKEEKKTLIDLLRKEKYVLTIGDILGLLQEMEENDYTIDETLRFNGVNKKYFYELYKNMVYTNKELHKKIKESLLNNKKRGFKKYIKLAYYITTLDFNDEEEFNNMFPELNLDKIIEDMEKLEKNNLVKKLKEIKQKINQKTKQMS